MGYGMTQTDETYFMIFSKNKSDALNAIKTKIDMPVWASIDCSGVRTLEEALKLWDWEPEVADDNSEDIIGIQFIGEKSNYEKLLFDAIAPYVQSLSYVTLRGEDGTLWRYFFNGKTCEEQYAKIVWE